MELTARDGQFIEYQFESIMHGSNMTEVVKWLGRYTGGFEVLDSTQKEALFSQTVQAGKASKKSLRYALSDPDREEPGFSPKTYSKNQQDFWNKENEYDEAEQAQKKAIEKRESAIEKRERLKDQKIKLLEQGVRHPEQQAKIEQGIRLLDAQVRQADARVQQVSVKVQLADTKVQQADRQVQQLTRQMAEIKSWMLNKAKVSMEDTADFINDLYDHRILMRPQEKARYERERSTLLEQLKEREQRECGPEGC